MKILAIAVVLAAGFVSPRGCRHIEVRAFPRARVDTVSLRRIGLYRADARYIGRNECTRVKTIRVDAVVGVTVSLLRPGAPARSCGDPRTSVAFRGAAAVDGARLFGRARAPRYLVACVRGRTLPAAIVVHIECGDGTR